MGIKLNHFVVYLKHCKPGVLQLKKKRDGSKNWSDASPNQRTSATSGSHQRLGGRHGT